MLENELKKRLNYDYVWGRKQTHTYDILTHFIYKTPDFEVLLNKIETEFKDHLKFEDLKNYTLNRWFNFWSSKGIETIFCTH